MGCTPSSNQKIVPPMPIKDKHKAEAFIVAGVDGE